jgi:hypothetical protein
MGTAYAASSPLVPLSLCGRANEVIEYQQFCCDALCPLLAQSGRHATEFQCPLLEE